MEYEGKEWFMSAHPKNSNASSTTAVPPDVFFQQRTPMPCYPKGSHAPSPTAPPRDVLLQQP